MAWWERLIYVAALAFWRAYFEMKAARQGAEDEVPNDKDRADTDRYRRLYERLRATEARQAGSDDIPQAQP